MTQSPDFPQKVLPYKTYNKIGHLSKSRLGEGDHYIDEKSEKMLTSHLEDQTCVVIVQEKLDGSNVCIVRWQGELRVLGRSGYDCAFSNQEQHRMFYRWVMNNRDRFEKLLPNEEDRVVGEWLALAHGTKYTLDHEPFVPFDLFEGQRQIGHYECFKRCVRLGFITPSMVHIGGACSINRAIKLVNCYSYHGAESPEGVIYRMEQAGKPKLIAKMVKHDKVDGKYIMEGETWNWSDFPHANN